MNASSFGTLRLGPNSVVSVEAARAIKNAIVAGRLRPGERLPPERELARSLGISRTSLRDALKVLSGMGLVHVRRSRGVFVAPAERPEVTSRRLVGSLVLRGDVIDDLFEIRLVLETRAAAWAAMRATDARLGVLVARYDELRGRAEQEMLTVEEANRLDSELHRLIAEATGNGVLVRIMEHLRGLLDESRDRTAMVPGRIARSVEEMGRIVEAVRCRDPQEAELEMYAHLKRGEMASSGSLAGAIDDGAAEGG